MGIDFKHYQPPGPVGARFIVSKGPIDLIMGPGGSGKTVASVVKGPRLAGAYAGVDKNGWVRVKTLCVRDTYRSFAGTALQSWYGTFPEKHAWTHSHEGGQDRPVKHVLRYEVQRGWDKINVEYTMETGAIGDNNLEQFFKGYEITYGWANECDILPENTMPLMLQRTGRFPPVEELAATEVERLSKDGRAAMELLGLELEDPNEVVLSRIVWGDYNPPDTDNWAVRLPITDKVPGYNHFWQPGGLDPAAENRVGKPRSSYQLEAATTKDKQLVKRMVHSQPGYAKDGTPVYEDDFNQLYHVADQTILPVPQLGLTIGIDAGGSPAATIGQFMPNGQNRLLAELPMPAGTGPTRFANALLELLMRRFPNMPIIGAWADPSAWFGGDSETGEFQWIMTVQGILRFPIQPAPSNEPSVRHEAVRWYLTNRIDGSTESYQIDPSCKKMIGGFAAHYKLTKQATASATDKLAVVKNDYSHPHDAEQYRCLGFRGLAAVIGDVARNSLPSNVSSLQRAREERAAKERRPGDFDVWSV
ncbi:hypothetical protein [Rhizobium tumorigenes]|uniref:hypothetical protein n=1 Tax=Rhizobium tumorigenes TaxID=2041385 RepID=UPI00241CFF63|nr:hypothetical protein [Rhizobium tumorigenes]WFS02206.1 hypothetical protein PR016_06225 [Rhizobium tumorigenes]